MHVCVCVCVWGVHACLQGAGDCLHCHTLPRPTVSIHKEGWVDRTARLHRERRGGEGREGEGGREGKWKGGTSRGGEERKMKKGKE